MFDSSNRQLGGTSIARSQQTITRKASILALDDDDSPSFQLTKMSSTWNARANTTTIILGRRKLYNNVISYIYSASNQAIYTEQLQLLSTDVKTMPWIYDTITMADRLWIVTL